MGGFAKCRSTQKVWSLNAAIIIIAHLFGVNCRHPEVLCRHLPETIATLSFNKLLTCCNVLNNTLVNGVYVIHYKQLCFLYLYVYHIEIYDTDYINFSV